MSPARPSHPIRPTARSAPARRTWCPELAWLEDDAHTTLVRKDCINGFVGAITADGRNQVVDWANRHRVRRILVVGICTDICVMDFVLTMLSARNHGLMPSVEDILVYEAGCATFDLPRDAALAVGLPETNAHPQNVTHYMGLYFMASRRCAAGFGGIALAPRRLRRLRARARAA